MRGTDYWLVVVGNLTTAPRFPRMEGPARNIVCAVPIPENRCRSVDVTGAIGTPSVTAHAATHPRQTTNMTIKIDVPTYDPTSGPEYDFSRPETLTLREEEGLRIFHGRPADEEFSGCGSIERCRHLEDIRPRRPH